MSKKEDLKFLYEKAISGREHHQNNFNHWMNMYALFNGALFIGFYTVAKDGGTDTDVIKILILALGFLEALFWHCSARGFYRWILSWIGVVQYYETELEQQMCKDEQTTQSEEEPQEQSEEEPQEQAENAEQSATESPKRAKTRKVYGLFMHLEKKVFKKDGKTPRKLFYKPFSTQKITILFTLCVTVAWGLLLAYNVLAMFAPVKAFFDQHKIAFCIGIGAIVVLGIIITLLWLFMKCREDLEKSHEHWHKTERGFVHVPNQD